MMQRLLKQVILYTMPIIAFEVDGKEVKANIPQEYIRLVQIINGLNKLELPPEARQIDKEIFYIHLSGWEEALLCVIANALGPKQKQIPLETAQLKAVKPFGDFLYSIFCLTVEVFNIINAVSELCKLEQYFSLYRDAYDWFFYICLEQELGEIFALLFPEKSKVSYLFKNSEREFIYDKQTKNIMKYLQVLPNRDAKKKEMRSEIKMLKNKENPFTGTCLNGDLYRLIQMSTEILKIRIQGRKDKEIKKLIKSFRQTWDNFVEEYAILLEKLHDGTSGSKMRFYKDGKLYEKISGRQTQLVYPEPELKKLKISRLKKSSSSGLNYINANLPRTVRVSAVCPEIGRKNLLLFLLPDCSNESTDKSRRIQNDETLANTRVPVFI